MSREITSTDRPLPHFEKHNLAFQEIKSFQFTTLPISNNLFLQHCTHTHDEIQSTEFEHKFCLLIWRFSGSLYAT